MHFLVNAPMFLARWGCIRGSFGERTSSRVGVPVKRVLMFFFKSLNTETGSNTRFLLSLFSIEFYFFLLAQLEDEMLVNQLILQEGYLSLWWK